MFYSLLTLPNSGFTIVLSPEKEGRGKRANTSFVSWRGCHFVLNAHSVCVAGSLHLGIVRFWEILKIGSSVYRPWCECRWASATQPTLCFADSCLACATLIYSELSFAGVSSPALSQPTALLGIFRDQLGNTKLFQVCHPVQENAGLPTVLTGDLFPASLYPSSNW